MSSRLRNPPLQNSDNINEELDKLTAKLKHIEPHNLEPDPNPEQKSDVWTEVKLEQEPKQKKYVSFFPPDLLQSRPSPPPSRPPPSRPPLSRLISSRPPPSRPPPSRPVSLVPESIRNNQRSNHWNMSFR